MARPRKAGEKAGTGKRRVEQYDHKGQQRKNDLGLEILGQVRPAAPLVGHREEHLAREEAPPVVVGVERQRDRAAVGLDALRVEAGAHKRVAVKIVDDRGIESLEIIPVP